MKKIINFRPILFLAISLCMGIATAYFLMRGYIVWAVLFICAFALILGLFLFLFTDKLAIKKNSIFVAVLCLFFLVGAFSLSGQLNAYKQPNLNGGYYSVTGRVKTVYQSQNSTKLVLDSVSVKGMKNANLRYNLALIVYGENDIDIGHVLTFCAHVYDNSYIYEGKFNASDVERAIRYNTSVSINEITIIDYQPTFLERINIFMRESLKTGLDKDEFAVGYAMLTGDDGYMDYDLISAYRIAGVAHIFAVSGLHIGFLAGALTFLFDKLRIRGYAKAITITVLLFLYSGVCGFSSSSIRATIMSGVLLFSRAKGYRYDSLSAIALAGLIILFYSPINLLCVGFQLSFAVVIGINLFSRPISRVFKFLPDKISSALGVVISAQLVAIPISLAHFGSFSWISVCANLIFVPFVSFIYILTFFACILGGIISISNVTLFISNYILKFVNLCIPALDNKIFMIGDLVLGGSVIAFYLALIIPCGLLNVRSILRKILTFTMVGVFVLSASIYTINQKNSTKLYVSGATGVSATLISTQQEQTLIISSADYIYSANRLKRIANDTSNNVVDNLVFMGGFPIDMQVFITKLRTAFEVKNVYYYGDKDASMETILKRSFKIQRVKNILEGQGLEFYKIDLLFTMRGHVLEGRVANNSVLIFSEIGKAELPFSEFDGYNYDYMICYDRADVLLSKYKPKNAISYLYSTLHKDAQSNGNLSITLS